MVFITFVAFYFFDVSIQSMHLFLMIAKYNLIEFVEAAKSMENWVGIEPYPRPLN